MRTCSSCCERGCSWQRLEEHRSQDPARKRSAPPHRSIPSVHGDKGRWFRSGAKGGGGRGMTSARLHTYGSAEQLLPVRFKVKNHAPPGTWEGGPTDEQHQKNQVGKCRSHPNDLNQKEGKLGRSGHPVRPLVVKH